MTETKKLNFCMCDKPSRETPVLQEVENKSKPYVLYGKDNKYPNYLWDLYLRSSILQSIINGTADFVTGNKIEYDEKIGVIADDINADGETLDDIIKKITVDYLIFGGFALNIIYNRSGYVSEIYWLDFRNVRSNTEGTEFYYSDNWAKNDKNYLTYPAFDPHLKEGSCIYYFKGHITRGTYPVPRYVGALAAIETSTEISKFHLNSILNNFSSNFIINYNSADYTQDEKDEIEEGIRRNFTGSENAAKFMIAFNDGKENAVTVARIPEDNFDNKYQALSKSTTNEIFVAFRAQPQLFGCVIEGSLFNKEEYAEAYALYDRACVLPIQKDIRRVFNKIFESDYSVTIEPLTIYEEVEEVTE